MAQAPLDNYPFSTKDGKVIPLDIIRPKSLIKVDFTTSNLTVAIPADLSVATVLSNEDCYIFLGAAPAITSGVEVLEALFLPKEVIMIIALEGPEVIVRGVGAGVLHIQFIEQWAGLTLDINYAKR